MESPIALNGDQRDAVVANLVGVPCRGHGDALFVISDLTNAPSAVSLDGCRVKWREGLYQYTALMRNSNLT